MSKEVLRAFAVGDQLSSDLASLRILRDEKPSSGARRNLIITAVAVVGVVVALIFAYPLVAARVFKTEVSLTEIALVSPAQSSVELTSTGYVVPQTTAKVGPKVTGRIARVRVKEGQSVKAGEILFELDAEETRRSVTWAQARATAARARAQASRAALAEQMVALQRQKKLLAGGAVAAAAVEDLSARTKTLEEQARAAEAEASAAQAEVHSFAVGLANYSIPAPMNGRAVTKPASIGDVVTPASTLIELVDFESLLVEVDVPEARTHLVKLRGPCEVILDAFPDRRYRGQVEEINPRLNRAKATSTVKVQFVDEPRDVLPEMSARVSFLQKALDEIQMKEPAKKLVASNAVVERGGAKVVFVLDGGRVRMVSVTTGSTFGNAVELKEGPPPGAKVVLDPPAVLSDGTEVKEKERTS